jgi:spermidine/putrescine-binding protein
MPSVGSPTQVNACEKHCPARRARDGETVLTRIHHRQTPLLLMRGLVDAGVTWKSEALFQEEIGNPISHVDIPEAQNTRAEYSGTMVKDAPHPEAARAWLDFIAGETGRPSRATASAAMGQVHRTPASAPGVQR